MLAIVKSKLPKSLLKVRNVIELSLIDTWQMRLWANNVVGKVLGFWQENLAKFNIDNGGEEGGRGGGVRGRIWNLKSFVQGCGKFLKLKR